jgi:hypothetical protein
MLLLGDWRGMRSVRKGDGESAGFESSEDRIFRKDGVWFFDTREGPKGPYLSRSDAEKVLSNYAETMEYLDDHRVPSRFDRTDVTIIRFDDEPAD